MQALCRFVWWTSLPALMQPNPLFWKSADGIFDLLAGEQFGGDAQQPAGCAHDWSRPCDQQQVAAPCLTADALQPRIEPGEVRIDEGPIGGHHGRDAILRIDQVQFGDQSIEIIEPLVETAHR